MLQTDRWIHLIAGSQKSSKHFGGCCDPRCHPGPSGRRQRETLQVEHKRCSSCPASHRANRNTSRPLSGLPLIPSVAVSAPKILCFYTSPGVGSCRVRASWAPPQQPPLLLPPSAASPLTPGASACINAETRQASSWQQLGFRSELFLSQTVKLVKIFHVLLRPLTIPSFLLVDVHGISPNPTPACPPAGPPYPMPPSVSLPWPVLHRRPVSHVIGGNVLMLFQFHMLATPSARFSPFFLFTPICPSCHPNSLDPHPALTTPLTLKRKKKKQNPKTHWTAAACFSWLLLKAFLPVENGDEERRAGWFPSATYLRVMGSRKSDPREFIMRITNPPRSPRGVALPALARGRR